MRAKLPLTLALAGVVGLGACTDVNTATEDRNQRAKEGAAIGAVLGAITGAATSDKEKKGAVIGGLIGAGVGAAIGNSLDKQAAELQSQLGNGIRVVNTGSELIVTMPQDILFPFDSAVVSQSLKTDLRTLADSLNDYPDTTVDVVGHTDSDGDASYNQRLSKQRADSVADILIIEGVAPYRIRAYGRGEDQPVATNQTEAGKAKNRRVEIIIRPNA